MKTVHCAAHDKPRGALRSTRPTSPKWESLLYWGPAASGKRGRWHRCGEQVSEATMGIFMFLVIKVMLPMMMTKMTLMMKMVCRYLGRDQRMTPPESPRESVHNNTSQVGSIEFNLKDKALFACLTLTYWNLKYGRIAVKMIILYPRAWTPPAVLTI